MKRFLLLMFVAVVALPACQESWTEDLVEPRSEITLQLNVPESSMVQTRVQSAAEAALNNLWLFVFNPAGTLAQKCKATGIKNDVHTANVTLLGGVGLSLYACANVSATEETAFSGLISGSATVADLKAITSGRSLLSASGLPMSGELTGQTITAATTKINMTLTRSCSRVDVVANGVTDFTLTGIEKLLKTATVGSIFPASSLVSAASTVSVVPTDKTLGSIYLYENAIVAADEVAAESKATAVIIKGSYKGVVGYYKLRIKYGTPTKYDIGRNVIYSINITGVKTPGFATLADAEASFPQNVDYNVTTSDGDATDLVTSNGQYYLGVSNSEYVVCNSDALRDVAVVTVTHNAPASITNGTITATGTGLTLKTTTILTSTQKQVVLIDLAAGATTGTLTLRLGNLMKVVNIKKKATITVAGEVNADYSATSYVQGDLDESVPTWLKFGKSRTAAEYTQKVQNPSGGLWMHISPNVGVTNTIRSSGAYVVSADSKGRSRVVVKQQNGILKYLSGAPLTKILPISPIAFIISVNTNLAGWTLKAYDDDDKPVSLTLTAKIGTPTLGAAMDCLITVVVANNLGEERTIRLYLSSSEAPGVELWCANIVQEKALIIIAE